MSDESTWAMMDDPEALEEVRFGYLTTDEQLEAVGALEVAAAFLEAAETGPVRSWKWSIVALHNAMVLALQSTWSVGVLHREQRVKKVKAESDLLHAIQVGDAEAAASATDIMFTDEGIWQLFCISMRGSKTRTELCGNTRTASLSSRVPPTISA
jgi:hypothetical protein